MAKEALSTDFKDDILSESMGGKRRWVMIDNGDGTVSFEDATTYDQTGSAFGQATLNAITRAVNESMDKAAVIKTLEDVNAVTEEGYVPDALVAKELNKKIEDRDASFRDGLSQIATSITDMGVTTASNASPETMASNIKKLVSTLSSSNQITSGNAGGYAENSPTVTLTYTATKECYVMVHLSAYYHNSGGSSTFTISGGTIIMDTGKKGTYSSAYQLTLVKLSKGTKLTMTAKNAGNISYSSREVAYIVFAI